MSLDSTWQIGVGGGALQPCADLGISNLTRRRVSQGTDSATFTVGGRNVDAAALFAYGATVQIKRGNDLWFVGRVTKTPATGSGSAQDQSCELQGPWWYMEHLVCRQQWQIQNKTLTALLSRLILGQALDGSHLTTGAVITEAVQYAINAGAPFQIGSILTGFAIPFDEVKDVTCAEVVVKMLRWHPDAVTWFDYSTTPPSLHIQARAALDVATVPFDSPLLVGIGEITPRHDLQAPAVVLHYEVTSTSDGESVTDVVTDAAPAEATGNEFGAVVLTIPLRGVSVSTTQARVVTVGIVDNLVESSAADARAFLLGQDPWLAMQAANPDITSDGITITAISRTVANANVPVPANPADPTGAQNANPYDGDLTRILLAGSITDWMASQYAIKTQVQRIDYTCTLDSGSGDGSGVSAPIKRSIEFTATNAGDGSGYGTSNYYTVTSFTPGDTVPTGLAAGYLASLNTLQWSGSLTLEEQLAGVTIPTATIGRVLNIQGSASDSWVAMNAVIVEEQVQVDRGRTTLSFGPTRSLTPADLVERLKTTRPGGLGGREGTGAQGTANSLQRTSGTPGGGNNVPMPIYAPSRNSTGDGGGGTYLKFVTSANGVPIYVDLVAKDLTPVTTDTLDAAVVNPP